MNTSIVKSCAPYWQLMRFNKPIGTLLLLWPTLWALWIASSGMPNLLILCVFVAGVIIMRAAGCVINDILDQKFDRKVERTRTRPLASHRLRTRSAFLLFGLLCIIALGLVLLLNRLTILLAIVGVILACLYPLTKRFTHWPQAFLGLAFNWGIIMAFSAVQNTVPPIAWILFLTCALWTIAYDTFYAMTDRKDDLMIGIKSTAVLFGRYDRLITALLQIAVLGLLSWVGLLLQFGVFYWISLVIAAGLFAYQHYLIRNRDPALCFKAFLNNNWVGLVLFLGIVGR